MRSSDTSYLAVLLYTLSNSRTGFSGSDTVIKRLMRAAVQTGMSYAFQLIRRRAEHQKYRTGALPGVFAVVTLILFFTKSQTQLYSLTGIPISRLYSTVRQILLPLTEMLTFSAQTLMDTILCRGELRDMIQSQRDPTAVVSLASQRLAIHWGFTPSIDSRIPSASLPLWARTRYSCTSRKRSGWRGTTPSLSPLRSA